MILYDKKTQITAPGDIAKIIQDILKTEDKIDQMKEHFYAIHMDTRNVIKLIELISLGSVDMSVVHPRETFRRAVIEGVSSIIIAHNHPSGEAVPSDADIGITKKLKEAGTILGIELLDHIIVTNESYYSFKEKHLL